MTDYPPGAAVTYGDSTATTTTGETVLARGHVNGPPIEHGELVYVPVWTARDNGREPTTVYVDSRNIVDIEPQP